MAIDPLILTLNAGSSSVKVGLHTTGQPPRRVWKDSIDSGSSTDADGVLEDIASRADFSSVVAVGHRIVHGGARFTRSQAVNDDLLAELHRLSALDPDHLPAEIKFIEAVQRRWPKLPQVACFDTAFHRAMPAIAKLLPIPRDLQNDDVQRYGFHGLSYTYLMGELSRVAGADAARGRVILAHLGGGSSLAAMRDGRCVDTTMGFTPTAGLMMGTRSGDLDPGLLVYLMRSLDLDADGVDAIVNHRSGLLGVSKISGDVRKLLALRGKDAHADEAIDLFCYTARKWIGAFIAVLGGVDMLVFSGGIGENAPAIRAGICENLAAMGIQIDPARNAAANANLAAIISRESSSCTVRVIATDEEAVIVNDVKDVCRLGEPAGH